MKTKGLIVLLMLFLLVNASCKRNQGEDNKSAALELYTQYASNEKLTVAYLGDYMMQENAIDALMIQTDDEEEWGQLVGQYGAKRYIDPRLQDTALHYSVEMELQMHTQSFDEWKDYLMDKEHLEDAEVDLFAQFIADQIRATIESMFPAEMLLSQTSVQIHNSEDMVNSVQFEKEFRDTTARERILSRLSEKLKDSIMSAPASKDHRPQPVELADGTTSTKEKKGHVTVVDYENQTLWLFFYSNSRECDSIMAHIRKDIFCKVE